MDCPNTDLPSAVIKGIHTWHRLPRQIRNAIEALFEATEVKQDADSEEKKRR
jgi:hypothetical protein